jgi:hypothetical protein
MSAGSPRELNFQVWRQWIQAADPTSKTEHHWICYTYNEKKQRLISVLSPEEYRDLSSKNSFWHGMHCQKIPLTEIISMTERLASQKVNDFLFTDLTLSLRVGQLFIGDAFSADWTAEQLVDKWMGEWLPEKDQKEAGIDETPRVISALENMCLRSEAKREALKAKGLWSKFLLFIYSIFNEIPEAKNLKIDVPKKQTEPVLSIPQIKKKICQLAEKIIKERIGINMESFAEKLPAKLRKMEDPGKDWNEVFQTPKDVKAKWLAFYAQDKIPSEKVSDSANTQRVRIQTLTKLWEDFKKYSDSIVDDSSQPQNDSKKLTSESVQPQLLESQQ